MTATKAWPLRKLSELGFVGRGKSRHRPRDDASLYGGRYPFVQTGDIKAADLYLTTYTQTYNEKGLAQSKLWQPGTLCITIAANIADTAILGVEACFPDSVVGFVPTPGESDAIFVKYTIDTIKRQMQSISRGTTQDNLSLDKLLTFDIPTPPIHLQRTIVSVLRAYDDLIEVNLRRIHILEEMARALYREWLVNFRFPHSGPLSYCDSEAGSIPAGWAVVRLGEILKTLESGRRPSGGVRGALSGVPSIGAENIDGVGHHNFAVEKFVPRGFFQSMTKGIVQNGDVAVYKDGAYIGKSSYFRDGFPHEECCVNEHVFLLRSGDPRVSQNALYLWLQDQDTVQALRATNANAAQPGLNQLSLRGLTMVAPDPSVASDFDQLVEPLFASVMVYAKQNIVLRRTRDLLLPRLLSGQIDLEAVESAA
jgi:type I restriction enzyme S subunit